MNIQVTDEWRNGRHVVYKLHAHIVLIPKYRRPVITQRVSDSLRASFTEVCASHQATLDEYEPDQNHAHLLVSYPPKLALSKLVMSLKSVSSKHVRARNWPEITEALWGKHFWSPSYAVVSCGGAPLETISEYIRNQQAPNRKAGRPVR